MASPDLSVSTSPTSVSLASQGEEQSPTITYTNVKELHKVIRQVPGDFLIVQNVSPADFEQISRPERRGFRLRRYHADRRLLIITIPTALHEALHINLYVAFLFKIGPIAQDIWKPIMSTTLRPQGHPGGDGGEGDSSGGPMSVRHDKHAWPTLVIEAGDSESLHALRDDMRWWFSASDHQVKIVLLAKFDHRLQQILIERWEEEAATRPGATTTRRAATFGASQPVLQQSITITRDPATGSYQVARSDLVLSFRLLFLRDPGPQEGDIIIPTEDLQHSPEIDLQVNSKASQSTAAPGRLVSTEFFMGDHLTYDIPRGPFRSSYDWLNAILTIIIRHQTLVLEKSEDEDDIEDAEDILPVAQTLLALLPKVSPPDLTTSESSALQHHDLNLNNILVNEQGEVTAVLDWEYVSALPLWMLTQMPKFLDGEPRDTLFGEMRFPGHALSLQLSYNFDSAIYCQRKRWSTRGWTFQESYLSRRLLVFTSIVSFHCQKHTSCEWWLDPHGETGRWTSHSVDRTSFICNVPSWPDIVHYIDVVREYSQKRLSFDDDILDAFASGTTVLNQSFHSGFHYGLPEVFFDASLLWEPDCRKSTSLRLRKTKKLKLPSWSWVRTKGSIGTSVWDIFAQDFYKDTSFESIYELKPRVQWWKTNPQGEALKLIEYQHFNNHASMPPGWTRRDNEDGYGDNEDGYGDSEDGYGDKYSHTLSPGIQYRYPFPFSESAEASFPKDEYGPLLRCFANRGWLIKSNKFEEPNKSYRKFYGTFNLCLSDGAWAGVLFDDRLDQRFPQKSGERCEVIAIAEGRVLNPAFDVYFPERAMARRAIFPGERLSDRSDFCYEFYSILWIGWDKGVAYRRGIGRVLKTVWEKMEREEIEVTLG
ncbi:hypothetical protein N5P37_008926 [Trichoderma harzianum]|nr:hypothetical protein N5P37_008926 [Trichoderma harzianum]